MKKIYFLEKSYIFDASNINDNETSGSDRILINIVNELSKYKDFDVKVFNKTTNKNDDYFKPFAYTTDISNLKLVIKTNKLRYSDDNSENIYRTTYAVLEDMFDLSTNNILNDDFFNGLTLIKSDFVDNDFCFNENGNSITIKKPISFTQPY